MARLYAVWNRLVMGALALLETLHAGLWLGLLRRSQLNAVTARFYLGQASYLDAGYNASGLSDWEGAAITAHFPSKGSVLVPGCGGGRELLGLASMGFRTTGFDPDPRFVNAAQDAGGAELAHQPVVLHAPPDEVPGGLGVHDACVLGWGAYTHVAGRDARIALLRGLARVLIPGAPLLLSFWACPSSPRRMRLAYRVASMVARLTFNDRKPEPGDWLGQHFVHYFDEEEIRGELREAGFDMLAYVEEPYAHAVARRA